MIEDYESCGECGYDHAYEYEEAHKWNIKMINAQGKLNPGDLLSDLIGKEQVYIYRWVPDYADPLIRPGDYVLLDPDEGRHYGCKRPKLLTARVSSTILEYRQNDEYQYLGLTVRRAHVDER